MYERIDKLWFSHRLGLAFNTAQLENDAKASFGDKLINSVTFPRLFYVQSLLSTYIQTSAFLMKQSCLCISTNDCRLLIPAVDKSCTPLKLCFFNNCFDDEFSNRTYMYNYALV